MCTKFVNMVNFTNEVWDDSEKTLRYVEALEKFDISDCDPCKTNLYRLMFEVNRSVLYILLLPLTEGVFKEKLRNRLKEWEIDELWENMEYGKGLCNADMVDIEAMIIAKNKGII